MRRNGLIPLFAVVTAIASPGLSYSQTTQLSGHMPDMGSIEATIPQPIAMPSDRRLKLQITMSVRNRDVFDTLPEQQNDPNSPWYQHQFSTAELTQQFGPLPGDYQVVEQWLSAQGFQIVSVDTSFLSRSITFIGTAAQVQNAFQVQLIQSHDGMWFANVTEPQVPASLAPLIGYIGGLHDLQGIGRGPTIVSPSGPQSGAAPATVIGGLAGFAPADFYSFYDENPLIRAGLTGSGSLIGIVGESNILIGAVAQFDLQFSLPDVSLNTILVDGTDPGTLGPPLEREALLDIEWAHAAAKSAGIDFYLGDMNSASPNGAIFDAIQRAVSDNTCGTISVSFVLCGEPAQFYQNTVDPVLNTARLQGQQVFIITGDFGAAALVAQSGVCVAGTTAGVNELAADPNAIAVGGGQPTAIPTTGSVSGFTPEQVFNTGTGASGGGKSSAFTKPNYQSGLTPNDGQRDVPDISLLAALALTNGQFTGVFIGDDSSGTPVIFCCLEGTSIAAPLWAGIGAIMQEILGTRISSNFNAQIYNLGRLSSTGGFRDVKTGNNTFNGVTGFTAKQGYDQATGWGTADITTFVNRFTSGRSVMGGSTANGKFLTTAEIFDPTLNSGSGGFVSGGTYTDGRQWYGETELPDQTVLVYGGIISGNLVKSAGIYSPSNGSFTLLSSQMPDTREAPTYATLLYTGKVFISGRDDVGQRITTVNYDPVAKTFSAGPNQIAPGSGVAEYYTQTLPTDGTVLIASGTAVAQIYDPIANKFTRTNGQPVVANRILAGSALLPDGRVLIAGGQVNLSNTASAEVYNPSTKTFSSVGSMTKARAAVPLTLLPNGKVLVAGGDGTADLFNPATNTFSAAATMVYQQFTGGVQVLNNGKVIVAAGDDPKGNPTTNAELYDPVANAWTATASMATARDSAFPAPIH